MTSISRFALIALLSPALALAQTTGPELRDSALSAGGGHVGGGDTSKIDQAAIELLLTGDGLKKAMINYFHTLSVDQITDPVIQASLARMLKNNAIQQDITTPGNYVIREKCLDSHNISVPASTVIGDLGGQICFDARILAKNFAGLSVEDGMIRLAAIAIHEHTHHFQLQSDPLEKNEAEANTVGGYIQITAKVEQVPVLKWDPSAAAPSEAALKPNATAIDVRQILTVTCLGEGITFNADEPELRQVVPNYRSTFIFRSTTARDGRFLLDEYITDSFNSAPLRSQGHSQIYYFKSLGSSKLAFEFLAGWKASGELALSKTKDTGELVGRGFINQKSHVTPLSCSIRMK